MKTKYFLASVFVCAASFSTSVLAQLDAAPQVFAAAPAEKPVVRDDAASVAAASQLRAALAAKKNPRFVLMWNKALSDNVATEYEGVGEVDRFSRTSDQGRAYTSNTQVRIGTKAVREREQGALGQDRDWTVRGDFEGWLINSGMNLVDRIAALRQAGLKVDSAEPNIQKLEMEALKKHADYMVEVLSTYTSDGPAGARFRVRVTSLATGQTIASFSSQGRAPEPTTTKIVAGRSGYEEVTETKYSTLDDVGQQLAIELARKVSGFLTAGR